MWCCTTAQSVCKKVNTSSEPSRALQADVMTNCTRDRDIGKQEDVVGTAPSDSVKRQPEASALGNVMWF